MPLPHVSCPVRSMLTPVSAYRSQTTVQNFPSVTGLPSGTSASTWGSCRFVRPLLRYYADVRLLGSVHVRITATGLPLPSRPLPTGAAELSRFSNIERLRMLRVSDSAGPVSDWLYSAATRGAFPTVRTWSAPRKGDFGAQWLAYASPVNASRAISRPPAHDSGP